MKKILPIFLLMLTGCLKNEKADLIIHNALIYTVDNDFSTHQAMAIKDGKIIALGKEREILNKYRYDEIYDAKTRPIYPGFIDAHCHFLGYGLSLEQVDLVGTKSMDEVIEKILFFSKTYQGNWIQGRGWDQNDWEVKEFPTKNELDSLFPNQPVFVKRIDGHAALANQTALDAANITIHTKIDGGEILIKNNELTGVLIDNAMELVEHIIPKNTPQELTNAMLKAQKNCFQVGLTSVADAGLNKNDIFLIDSIQQAGLLKMKIYAMLTDNQENFDYFLQNGPYRTPMLNVCSFKFYADGALGSRGACLLAPYHDMIHNKHVGFMLKDTTYYRQKAKELLQAGFQMNTHCIGDSANRFILNVYAQTLQENNDKRWRIEHCQVLNENDFELFRKYGIIPSVQPTHATSDMYWAKDRLGDERIKNAYAYKKLLQQLGIIALGTDFPIESIDPLETFYAAVIRKDKNDFPSEGFNVNNALSRQEALMGMTIWAALANFEENEKGSLEIGKSADFVILQKDIMTVEENELKNNKVIATFINGKKVFE
jgi:predicted amidohydrolase YtcJ